ncbi:aminotransferase class V-fold PLP-dependent enzyme [Reichenbachiella agariperforans]|uniref:aminotransferase class V-fold PLP-dependent enzyme n=1 Tax=Reichenbachiella agariperforans TaxID=156994 RepID=UPI001C08D14B|nr:aminotransferase class V-fold PLP-dependent enzyme [Reichenbachiella agariperforans]MBU2914612.1 aminotransferase class V-fold PLP-dependent enzyme [Reichenbachiella agariperforans]
MTTTLTQMIFDEIRKNIVGWDQCFDTAYGRQQMIYADWVAGGRLYRPIEDIMVEQVGPWVANTHSYSNRTGSQMTAAYQDARKHIKSHVGAKDTDILVTTGSGMTGAVHRLIQIMKLDQLDEQPVILMSHMEHHSHQVAWIAAGAEVVIVAPNDQAEIDLSQWESALKNYEGCKTLIGAFTAGSNVTGILTPVHALARLIHRYGGQCFVDYAATAPYVEMNMHPSHEEEKLDAIYFSPHKFLGGPGACGVLLMDEKLYHGVSSVPGGGNVTWTKPAGGYGISTDPETKEDGGTPAFLQTIRAALAIRLKEKMDVKRIEAREKELLKDAISGLQAITGVQIIGGLTAERIGVVSFNLLGIHYNAVVRMLNDRFGVQVRGGWACASTYVHYLFGIDQKQSDVMTGQIDQRNLTDKPGFVRLSLHPTMTDQELAKVLEGVAYIATHKETLIQDYVYDQKTNDFALKGSEAVDQQQVDSWFKL